LHCLVYITGLFPYLIKPMKSQDLSKQELYESVKALVDKETVPHLHLDQHKLFTLFSIAFQYFLYCSTKKPGAYIIRIEDSSLADKLARKAKDPSTRKFIQSLLLPRKLKYGKSTFLLDFFHVGTWGLTSEIPKDKLKGALIIKNTSSKPMAESLENKVEEGENAEEDIMANLPPNYFLTSLIENVPKTITIAFETAFEELEVLQFDFIKKDKEKSLSGVTISKDIDLENLD
jgi:hypothetical protein